MLAIGAGVAALLLLVWGVVWLVISTTQPAQKREGDALVRKSADEETGDAADRTAGAGPADGSRPPPQAGLKPGKPIDEKQVQVPTKSRFNAKNLHETAEWVLARTLEAGKHRDNAFRVKNELKALNEQMKALVGKDVGWRFTVRDILEDRIRFQQTWSTFDGSRYPKETNNLFPPGGLIVVPRFRVVFYHEGIELDPINGPISDGLVISHEIGDKQAAALKPNDVILVKGKIKAFRMEDDLLSTGFPSDCAVCTLEADRTEESKRERNEQVERQRRAQELLEKEELAREERVQKERERLAREARQEEKRKRAAAIEHHWGAIDEWQAELRRTGAKEPSVEWQQKWQQKWGPITPTAQLYPPAALAELQEEDRRVGGASKEWRTKWREKWDKVEPNP